MVTEKPQATRNRARLTRQGQITVPKAVRDALGARPGDEIEFVARGQHLLIEVRPRRSILEFAGIGARAVPQLPETAEALDELIDGGMAEEAVARDGRVRQAPRRAR